jgi:uncharacterized protein YcbK (DUF882 family)
LATLKTVSVLPKAARRGNVRFWHTARIATLRALLIAVIASCAGFAAAPEAFAETRSLKLYYIHTKEKAEIVFKRNGRYDKAGLNKLNRFLRDWRRNEPTNMDPRLFDLVWEVYQQVGAFRPTALRRPTTCCAGLAAARPRKASTRSARRWISTSRVSA